MTHLLDNDPHSPPHNNGVAVTPREHERAGTRTVLRFPREPRRRQLYRPYPAYAEMVDSISPYMLLGCALVSLALWGVLIFAFYQLGRAALELTHHIGGIA